MTYFEVLCLWLRHNSLVSFFKKKCVGG